MMQLPRIVGDLIRRAHDQIADDKGKASIAIYFFLILVNYQS
ncbi:hypothetical protein [Paenibacillus sp. 2TAB19]